MAGTQSNDNGGFYNSGTPYCMAKKMDVLNVYLNLFQKKNNENEARNEEIQEPDNFMTTPTPPSCRELGKATKVSHQYAAKVIKEYNELGTIVDP